MLTQALTTRPLATEPIRRRLLLAWSSESPRTSMADEVWQMAVDAYDEVQSLS
jgi:hypothetical protein